MSRKNRTQPSTTPATTPELENAPVETTEQVAPVETPAPSSPLAMVYDKQIGIIGHLRTALSNPGGVTKGEMNVRLAQLFPDRDPMGMATTVQIQLGRLQKKYGKISSVMVENRGRVYGWEATLEVAQPAPAAPVAEQVAEEVIAA
jgi:hypothetical protein